MAPLFPFSTPPPSITHLPPWAISLKRKAPWHSRKLHIPTLAPNPYSLLIEIEIVIDAQSGKGGEGNCIQCVTYVMM